MREQMLHDTFIELPARLTNTEFRMPSAELVHSGHRLVADPMALAARYMTQIVHDPVGRDDV